MTHPNGDVVLQPGLPRPVQAQVLRHEGVHKFLSPKDQTWLAKQRQELLKWGYERSHLLRYLEEGLAEGIATKSVANGLRYPITHDYGISIPRLAAEAAAVGTVNAVPWYKATQPDE